MQKATPRVAVYARYSDDKQQATSVEDQIRRCREVAARYGLAIDPELVFSDSAITGRESGEKHREGFRRLREAWDARGFDVLLVDEFSRLSRDAVTQAKLQRQLENDRRVRMITADGVDTAREGWQLQLGLHGVMAQYESRRTQFRVPRGMQGQLERGYMIAAAPFGYDNARRFDDFGTRIGTHWVINEWEAQIVRKVFEMREAGSSMHQIAAWLNTEGIPCSRGARTEDGGYWRPSRVKILLGNPAYRGVFIWHGSTTYRSRMEKLGDPVETVEYPRPELRLVSDETWFRCNSRSISRTGYGGGKHVLAGLVTCGFCRGTLALTARSKRSLSMYCPACTVAKAVKGVPRLTSTVRATGVQQVLSEAIRYFLSPEFLQAFRHSLDLRMNGDNQGEIDACRSRLDKLRATQERLSRMLQHVTDDDPVLEARYGEARNQVVETQRKLAELEAARAKVNAADVERQKTVDPAAELVAIFDAELPPERLRAVLARLFPQVVFVRASRHSKVGRQA
ncbi:hypothetical protein CY652_20835 [Burkholderia sp. WAC0059]|uniref:recombinase family protein n=1 Tax=Burkholderia sp. WAC0059 TaxID=2066022 RepID=UPI000C7F1F41|nr:recombinase family protein [Burkholderia sp. WAC0059]PLZ00448.1 hypothetical protein CY652_20835 [Burkholderia sp. WAC0059]